MSQPVEVVVYRSAKRDLTYLYVPAAVDVAALPVAVVKLGPWERTLAFALTPGRKLAQVDATRVLAALARDGFYIQFPPKSRAEG